MTDQKIRAFTIVELLVVVTIIGILAAAVTVSVLGFRAQSRDSRRAADFNTMEKTLAAYYADHFAYPSESACDASVGQDADSTCPPAGSGMSTPVGRWDSNSLFYGDLVPGYISALPVDPLNIVDPVNNISYYYYYEPTNGAATGVYPDKQCFTWIYALESGGRRVVREDVGDVSWNTTYPNTCESLNPAVTY